MKEIEENKNNWKDISCSLIEIPSVANMLTTPKITFRFNEIHIKILITVLQKEKIHPKIYMENQKYYGKWRKSWKAHSFSIQILLQTTVIKKECGSSTKIEISTSGIE